jgi:hypothetical protein
MEKTPASESGRYKSKFQMATFKVAATKIKKEQRRKAAAT